MSAPLTPLVDLDGTLVQLVLDWDRARDEAEHRNLPRRIASAISEDTDGAFRRWLDEFESTAEIVPLHAALHDYLRCRTWALVTNNGGRLIDRVVREGHIPHPDVVVCRDGFPLKPAADQLFAAVTALARIVEPRPVYIGDSEIDKAAASAAHMPFLPVAALAAPRDPA